MVGVDKPVRVGDVLTEEKLEEEIALERVKMVKALLHFLRKEEKLEGVDRE